MVRGLKIYEHTVGLDIWTFCFLQNITTSKNNQNFPESKMRSDTTLLQFLLSDRKNKLIEAQVRVCVVKGYSFYRLLEQICFQTFSETILFSGLRAGKAYPNIQSLLRAEREEIRRKQRERERERERGRKGWGQINQHQTAKTKKVNENNKGEEREREREREREKFS